MTTITLNFNNFTTDLTSDEHGRYSLNKLHKASGLGRNKVPSRWMDSDTVLQLIEELQSRTEISVLVTNNGGRAEIRGTWATEQIVYAYATWLGAEFHAAVIEAFTHAAAGDGDAAVATAQRAVTRSDGIQIRRGMTGQIPRFNPVATDYSRATNAIYQSVFGMTAEGLRNARGLRHSQSIRDNLSEDALIDLAAAEAIMTLTLRRQAGSDARALYQAIGRGQQIIESSMRNA